MQNFGTGQQPGGLQQTPTPQYWNQPGYQGPVGPNGEAPGTWGAMTTSMQPLNPQQQAAMAAYQGSPAQLMAQQNARNPNFMANAWNQQVQGGGQIGQLGSMLANQGAGAANQGAMGQGQMNPQLMQALMAAFAQQR
jgi:hypothetical protein